MGASLIFINGIIYKTLTSDHWHLKQKRENCFAKTLLLTLMGASLIVRNGIIYIINFKISRELIIELVSITST